MNYLMQEEFYEHHILMVIILPAIKTRKQYLSPCRLALVHVYLMISRVLLALLSRYCEQLRVVPESTRYQVLYDIDFIVVVVFSSTAYDVRVTEEFAEPAFSTGFQRHSWGTQTFNL